MLLDNAVAKNGMNKRKRFCVCVQLGHVGKGVF